ncbi:MAG: riboflavin synthase [Sphingomonadaceae bacterium]
MFTGIVTDIGRIESVEERGDRCLRIACAYDMETLDLGASIACSGACLTVVDKGKGWFAVDISAETANRTAPGMWEEGGRLNLERSLKLGDELGGHIVTGHVDGVGEIVAAAGEGGSTRIAVEAPAALAPYIAEKGSIALDGVSLTVTMVEPSGEGGVRFGLNLIPHTAEATTFDRVEQGRNVNIEIDILARYLERLVASRT